MGTAFKPDEISSEELLKGFLKEVFLDDAIAALIAAKLVERGIDERTRIITALCVNSNMHRSRWTTLVSNIK